MTSNTTHTALGDPLWTRRCRYVHRCETDCLANLWQRFGSRTGINRQEFLDYFEGVEKGAALTLSDPDILLRPIPLGRLRETSQGFRPPQSFAYVNAETGNELLTTAA